MQDAGGTGIIPFELAGPQRSETILHRWGTEGRRAARASLVLDFPFLVAYTTLGLRVTRRTGKNGSLRRAAGAVSVIQIGAGACDAIENAALLGVIARGGDARLASIARAAARAKFAGLAIGLLYWAAALVGILGGGE